MGGTICWTWAFDAEGETVAEGMDFVILDENGRIQRFVVFDGRQP